MVFTDYSHWGLIIDRHNIYLIQSPKYIKKSDPQLEHHTKCARRRHVWGRRRRREFLESLINILASSSRQRPMMMDDRRWRFRGRRARLCCAPPTLSFENENKVRTGRLNDLHSMVHLPISFGHYNISRSLQTKPSTTSPSFSFCGQQQGSGQRLKKAVAAGWGASAAAASKEYI